MRAVLISMWLFIGLAGLIFHLGPGRELERIDEAGSALTLARYDVADQRWGDAIERIEHALGQLPEDQVELQRELRLEKAKAQMMAAQLPEARLALEGLLEELLADLPADSPLVQETRLALASSQYYVTWLMRLEGLDRDEWEPEIEAARQNYRLLAEQAEQAGSAATTQLRQEDLEAAIRLARMNLSDLQALPLPGQCRGCDSGLCRGRSPKPGNQRNLPGGGAGFAPPGEGAGS